MPEAELHEACQCQKCHEYHTATGGRLPYCQRKKTIWAFLFRRS